MLQMPRVLTIPGLGLTRDQLFPDPFVDMGGETFNPASICGRSLAVLGVGGEDLNAYEGTLALLDRHRHAIPLQDMVSHRFDVAHAPAAMALALDADASAKVLITPGRREREGADHAGAGATAG